MTRSLGRGLASLIPDSALDGDTAAAQAPRSGLRTVPLDEIKPNPEQPREHFDPEALEELAASIRQHGLLMPLVVRRHAGSYVLIAGERRMRASALAGLQEVPVVIRDAPDALEQLELALVENLQRADLDVIELAKGYARLQQDFGLTQEQVAKRVGKDRATVANAIRLLKLPDMARKALRDRQISAGHARALLPLADTPDDLREVLVKVISSQLSVRATERLVAQRTAKPRTLRVVEQTRRDQTYAYATKLLTDALQAQVAITPKQNGSGRITIQYTDAEELERLIGLLRTDA